MKSENDEFDYSLPLLKKEKDWPLIFAVIFGSFFWICYFSMIGFALYMLYKLERVLK